MRDRLTDGDIDAALARLPGWTRDGDALRREFRFAGFREAIWFINAVAAVADRMDHHPEWCNVYSRVDVRLSTHSAGGITELDVALAEAMNQAAG